MIKDITAPLYSRNNREWHRWLGRQGRVVASTMVRAAAPVQQSLAPYSYVLVDFGDEKRSFMGVGQQKLAAGDQVECVWRKLGVASAAGIINYGIKVRLVPSAQAGEIAKAGEIAQAGEVAQVNETTR